MRVNGDLFECEWFPPSTCFTGIEEALPAIAAASSAASAGAGVVGSILKAHADQTQGQSQAQALEAKAAADRAQANLEAGYYQRQAIEERRKTQYVQSRLQATAAAQGGPGTALDPSTVALEQGVAQQGDYNALSQLAAGQTREAALNYQSQIDLFNARRYRAAIGPAVAGDYLAGAGRLATAAGSYAANYRRTGPYSGLGATAGDLSY